VEHTLIQFFTSGDKRFLNPDTGRAQCERCGRQGVELSLVPCWLTPFGIGDENEEV